MKILITGGSGQLGFDCNEVMKLKHEVISFNHRELDISDAIRVREALADSKPVIVINCGAYTKVDACEAENDLAMKINAFGAKTLAEAIKEDGGKLIHISTDYVFDGKKKSPEPYIEGDPTDPQTYYGKSKLKGEKAIEESKAPHVILRTAWLYGINGHNFLKTMLKLSLKDPGRPLKVVNDQFGSVTWTHRLALQIEKIIETDGQGIYHATSEGYGTWFETAQYFLNKMKVPHNLVPCSNEEFTTPARRPANSILENKKLKDEGINLMINWKEDIDIFVSKFKEQLTKEAEEKKQ